MQSSGTAWLRTMTARDTGAAHRASTNLELLFDLTFVVAVAKVAKELATALAAGHLHQGIQGYLSVFFAIWWAWMNFTWFASAFDTDDVPYRVLTLLQMVGVLVLAAGIPGAFESANFTGLTVGYVIMRVAMVAQWVRAGLSDPPNRKTALRYVGAVSVVQVGWVARLALPAPLGFASFLVLALLDVAAPLWAERSGMTSWHPEHIAERYGLFTIIVLGEGIAQISSAFDGSFTSNGVTVGLVGTAIAGLVMLFSLWWLYFARPVVDGLRQRPNRVFLWGYGHLILFAALAAVAAGLEVAIQSLRSSPGEHGVQLSDVGVALAVAVPAAIFLLVCAALVDSITADSRPPLSHVAAGSLATVVLSASAAVVALPTALALLSLPSVLLVADTVIGAHRARSRRTVTTSPSAGAA